MYVLLTLQKAETEVKQPTTEQPMLLEEDADCKKSCKSLVRCHRLDMPVVQVYLYTKNKFILLI